MLGLYVHIPFCKNICHYCDFVKRVPKDEEVMTKYIDKLIEEIESYENYFSKIDTIFIGGGTPNYLSISNLERLFKSLVKINPKEYTIEINAELYNDTQGDLFKKYGINRVSIGAQTFDLDLLKYLNRRHTPEDIYRAIGSLNLRGIDNISLDLIYSIPGQTIKSLKNDLNIVKSLPIKHVSAYSLILEKNTYFYWLYDHNKFEEVDEDLSADMFELIMKELSYDGFNHYEISNYAKPGYESIHNKIYWNLDNYIGVGLGAHGLIKPYRYYNDRAYSRYLKKPLSDKVKLEKEDLLSERMIMGLRLMEGINIKSVEKEYNIKLKDKFTKIKELEKLGLLKEENDYLKLTHKGIMLGNQVFEIFV